MSGTNNFIFQAIKIIAWIIFVGLCIEAGGLIVNFVFAVFNPRLVPHLYQQLDLSGLYARSRAAFFSMYSFLIAIAVLKAVLFYVVIRLVTKLDLVNPFNKLVATRISSISYFTFSIGLIGYLAAQTARGLDHRGYELGMLNKFWSDSEAFILMAAVIYVIAAIFNKGIELQTDKDLTI